ncbi:MAG TPA: pyridoxal phosphate-dependent aminotransferase [Thermoanaerobaculia bacterium]|nr:pyridoxal phosphate-dependent aminotransferase [Thermoanaerobaculia bacterium]HUM30453.1 pyridoxal phosphate-dependent aminotransferase [Thermoanaerobaculia bacterium]HXK68680.1 pyridoxal phosphate-dependent aminotransferase [Thermoanaerobaculia bacterium]
MISDRVKKIGASPTLRITAKAKAMKAEGIDVIDLSVGEPDFPTPEAIKAAGKRAIDENFTRYTASDGIPELKSAIIQRIREDHGLSYTPAEILVSCGAKHALYNAIMALVNEGDEVIIPAPYWVSYPEMVNLAGGVPVILQAKEENHFRITPRQLRAAITARTKVLILNNPSNPTGAAYSRLELEALADIVLEEDLFVITDEIYKKLVYDDFSFTSFPAVREKLRSRVLAVDGISKAYAMTGWRIGFAMGPADLISAMAKIQSHSTSNATSIAQKAGVEALKGPQHEVSRMLQEFQKRRNYLLYRLGTIPGVSCPKPDGAFYCFPNVSSYFDREFEGTLIRNSYGMAYYLLKHAGIALVPGAAFGSDEFIRISYATSMENIERGMDHMVQALGALKTPRKVKKLRLANTGTRVQKQVPLDTRVERERRNALVAEAEAHLSHDQYFEWNANINGVLVQLRTNIGHLVDFWTENWYPAQLEADIEPHGIIYAVDGVTGREPHAFYCSDAKTGILFNTDHYGSLRRLALGLVSDVSERLFDTHAVRGMSLDMDGWGVLLIGPKGTHKSEIFFNLLGNAGTLFHSSDMLFVRYGGGFALADNPERKIYMPTASAELYSPLPRLFDRSKCENVVMKKEDCSNSACLALEDCRLDRGSPYCYKASSRAHAMLDPYWLGGMQKHVKRIDIRHTFLLTADPLSSPFEPLQPEEAVRILETGQAYGVSREPESTRSQPFYNPYFFFSDSEHLDHQTRSFKKLFRTSRCYRVNTTRLTPTEVARKIRQIIAEGE